MTRRFRKLRMEQMESREMMAVTALGDLNLHDLGDALPVEWAPTATVPVYNSLPGAPASLYLDFDGHFQAQPLAGVEATRNVTTPVFDMDGDPTTFSDLEQQEIRIAWAVVAEDYAPFNINVTTVEPDASQPFMRIVISGESDFTGGGRSGFSDTGTYASNGPNIGYVFRYSNGRPSAAADIGSIASHEAGHAFGLNHYSDTTGDSSIGPIMREHLPIALRRTWWSNGSQTDMAVIARSANGFGYRPDDHGDFVTGTSPMSRQNHALLAQGIIGVADTDVFYFDVAGGQVTMDLNVPPDYIANLNADLLLYNSKGALIAFDSPPDKLGAKIVKDLPAGRYYAAVQGDSAYGDVGQYTLIIRESGAQVVSSKFQALSKTQMGLYVTFSEAIDLSTFTIADVRINGGAAGAGVLSVSRTSNDAKTFLIAISVPSNSPCSVSIGPNINDMFGNTMDQNKNGMNGEAVDAFMANYIPLKGSLLLTTTTKTTAKKRR